MSHRQSCITYNLRKGLGYLEGHGLVLVAGLSCFLAAGPVGITGIAVRRRAGGGDGLQSRQGHRRGGAHGVILFLVARDRRGIHGGVAVHGGGWGVHARISLAGGKLKVFA